MTNTQFLNQVSPALADVLLEVDGYETNIYEFLWTNMIDPSALHITIEDAERVLALKINESTYISLVEIKRIA